MLLIPLGLVWGVSSLFICGILFMAGIPFRDTLFGPFIEWGISLIVLLPVTVNIGLYFLLELSGLSFKSFEGYYYFFFALSGIIAIYLLYGLLKIIKLIFKKLKSHSR